MFFVQLSTVRPHTPKRCPLKFSIAQRTNAHIMIEVLPERTAPSQISASYLEYGKAMIFRCFELIIAFQPFRPFAQAYAQRVLLRVISRQTQLDNVTLAKILFTQPNSHARVLCRKLPLTSPQ